MDSYIVIFCDTFYDYGRIEFQEKDQMDLRVSELKRTGQTVIFAGLKSNYITNNTLKTETYLITC